MSILLDPSSRIMVQGITGRQGRFHSKRMMENGTQIVGGTSPGQGGDWCFDGSLPIFDTVRDCIDATNADTSVLFVPPHSAADAIIEAIDCGIKTIISITGSIPLHDMMQVRAALNKSNSLLIGPNSPGVLVPEIGIAGVFPDEIATKGNVAVISRSGTLIYEVLDTLKISNIGVSTAVGIGDDPISGIDFRTCLELFESDPHTEKIVMIGGPGGVSELNAASYIMEHVTKPVIAYLVGENLSTSILRPLFSQNGALVLDAARAKTQALVDAGALLANTIEEIPTLLNR